MQPEIGRKGKLFNLYEARSLLPLVQSVTRKHQATLAPVRLRMSKMLSNDPRRNQLEREYEAIVSQWRRKIELLGAHVSGLWIVEFNVGEGYLSWRYPELSLSYFRSLGATFSERIKLDQYIDENDPDWVH